MHGMSQPTGERLRLIDPAHWGPILTPVAEYLERVASAILCRPVPVNICRNWNFRAHVAYGRDVGLLLNYSRLQPRWFVGPVRDINETVLLGLAHHYSTDPNSVEYREGLACLGARMLECAFSTPATFQLIRPIRHVQAKFLPPPPEPPGFVVEIETRQEARRQSWREFAGPLRRKVHVNPPAMGALSNWTPAESSSADSDVDAFLASLGCGPCAVPPASQ